MESFQLLAQPFWVNLTIFIPFIAWYSWKKGLKLSRSQLISAAVFALAFGMTEAIVVIYLRTIAASEIQTQILLNVPSKILSFEQLRNFFTIVMLAGIAFLGTPNHKERWALFFYSFAIWDIFYYVGLRLLVGWPQSLLTPDVLFLIPVPWLSQVWFPLLVCSLLIVAVLIRVRKSNKKIT